MNPRAKSDVLLERLDDELIVYDPRLEKGHCLNRTAALVWQLADGQHSIAEMAAVLRRDLDPAADEDLVWHALDHLDAVRLLDAPLLRSADEMRASRRRFISRIGLLGVASLLLPAVTTSAAPAASAATSSGSSGGFGLLQAEWLAGK